MPVVAAPGATEVLTLTIPIGHSSPWYGGPYSPLGKQLPNHVEERERTVRFRQIGRRPGILRPLLVPLRANDVMAMIGMSAVVGSARTRRVTSMPETFGS